MRRVALLSEAEYQATMGTPMVVVGPDDPFHPVPLGPYTALIPAEDFQGHDFSARNIETVYRDPSGRFLHVLVAATKRNVYLVIIVDEPAQSIHGHYLLDLNKLYGVA